MRSGARRRPKNPAPLFALEGLVLAVVQTVTGPLDPEALGFTYMHEHVLAATPGLYVSFPHLLDRDAIKHRAVSLLSEAHRRGLRTLVDMSPADFHRDPELVLEVSESSGVQIVHATGAYNLTTLFFRTQPAEVLSELFIRDIEQGMSGTDVRAGILKCATGPEGMTDLNRKLLEAVAAAHLATGVPIGTHTDMASHSGLQQQEILRAADVDLERVVIGHSNDVRDVPYLEQLIDAGSWVGMDRFGLDLICPEQDRIELLVEMCEMGYADRIVLSHDASAMVDFVPSAFRDQPHWNWNTIPDRVLPALRARGVSSEQIQLMTVENPRRIFSG